MRTVLMLYVGLMLAQTFVALSQEGKGRYWFVFNTNPPSIVKVDSQTRAVVKKADIGPNPSYVLLAPESEFLYVLCDGAFD